MTVTPTILANMLKSSLNYMKSFTEQLNAELTEEDQEDDIRQMHRMSIAKSLEKFGKAEASLEKGIKCLRRVEMEMDRNLVDEDDQDEVDQKELIVRIRNIIRETEGSDHNERDDGDDEMYYQIDDEREVVTALQKIEHILDEFHPLKLVVDDDNGGDNSDEEDRMCQRLENMLKRATAIHDEDVEEQRELEDLEDFNGEELDITAHSFERIHTERLRKKAPLNKRIQHMYKEFEKQLIKGPMMDSKQLIEEKMSNEPDLDISKLPFFSKFNNDILELFSKEAVVVVQQKTSYMDPISKTAIQNPVKNKLCNHVYERDSIFSLLQKKKVMSCPFMGCSNRAFSLKDLEEDEEIAEKIIQNLRRAQLDDYTERDNGDEEMEEVHSDDDSQCQEILQIL